VTLIIGIKCSNGIVLGADGAATFGVLVHESRMTKVEAIGTMTAPRIRCGMASCRGPAAQRQMAKPLGRRPQI
jgi:20S proteasome alpha/beta subunit